MTTSPPPTNPVQPIGAKRGPRVAFASTGVGIYPVVVALFCSLLLLSNIGATKGIAFGPILTDGGALLFPLTYVLGDVMTEVYGFRASRRAILLGFVIALIASLSFYLVSISPPAPGYENQTAFDAVLGVVPRILLASVCGYLIGEFLNSFVLVKIKERTRERHLWARLIGSTVVGEFGDTLIFCVIAGPAIGISTVADLTNYTLIGFAYKTCLEIVLLPITYRVIAWIKMREPSYQQAVLALEPARGR